MTEENKKLIAQSAENLDLKTLVDILGSTGEVLQLFKGVVASSGHQAAGEPFLAGIEKELKRIDDERQAGELQALFEKANDDILNGRNLAKWSNEIELAIIEVDERIASSEENESFKVIRNWLFGLKYLIAEAT